MCLLPFQAFFALGLHVVGPVSVPVKLYYSNMYIYSSTAAVQRNDPGKRQQKKANGPFPIIIFDNVNCWP